MKNQPMNLLIVDKNKQIVDKLSEHLKDKFGMQVNISSFVDAESCMLKVDDKSHVIVLDYFMNNNENGTSKSPAEIFNVIKAKSPNTKVTMISSEEEAAEAIEEMKKQTSSYVVKHDDGASKLLTELERKSVSPAYSMIISPIKVRIIMPIVKIISEYTLRDYLIMFIIAFISVGSLVYLGLKLFR